MASHPPPSCMLHQKVAHSTADGLLPLSQEEYIRGAVTGYKAIKQAGGRLTLQVMEKLQMAVLLAVMFGFTSPPRISCMLPTKHPRFADTPCTRKDCPEPDQCTGNVLIEVIAGDQLH